MPSKQKVLEDISKIEKPSVSIAMLKDFVSSVSNERDVKPRYLKKGDIILSNNSFKKRPCVVIKVLKKFVFAIPLTTKDDELTLHPAKDRFLGNASFFSHSIVCIKTQRAIDDFAGVYDNPKLLNKAIKLLKEEISAI